MCEKKAYRSTDVNQLQVPAVPELSLARVWGEAIKLKGFLDYMPDDWQNEHHRTDRAFFYGVLATFNTGFVE